MINISVAQNFTHTPGPRYREEGSFSGEEFRETLLAKSVREALDKSVKLLVDLDGTAGYGTSFLEESFGGLIREEHIQYEDIQRVLEVKSIEKPKYKKEIETYLRRANEKASTTVHH